MARIMCTQKLWRRLGHGGRPPAQVAGLLMPGVSLGSWAATVFRFDRRDLVIALNERTYMTLVFPLAPRSAFRGHFADALVHALEDLGVSKEIAGAESAAIAVEPLAQLTNRGMAGTLNDLEFHCGIELEYHDDLRRVQRNLNDLPHANREPCVPVEAVGKLFEGATPSVKAH